MNTVLCVSGHPEDLADGRVIGHGETATKVDLDQPANRALLDEGRISVVAEPAPAAVLTIDETLEEVGNDREKAQAALDIEQAAAKPRSTLITRLEAIVSADTKTDEGDPQ